MKKIYCMILSLLLSVTCVVRLHGQQNAYTLPYFCNFEDDTENANWVLNNRQQPALRTFWSIGTGAHKAGIKALYVNTGDESSAEYYGDDEQRTLAYRAFPGLARGSYDLAFDWRALGDMKADKMNVYWLPQALVTTTTSTNNSQLPGSWSAYEITGGGLSGQGVWQFFSASVSVTSSTTYVLMFVWVNNATNTFNPGVCVDNVQLALKGTNNSCGSMPQNLTVTEDPDAGGYVVRWDALTQPVTYDLLFFLDGAIQIDTIADLTSNSVVIPASRFNSGLYNFMVRSKCSDGAVSVYTEVSGIKCINYEASTGAANACPEVTIPADMTIEGELKRVLPGCSNKPFMLKPRIMAGGGQPAGYRVDPILYNPPTPNLTQMTQITRDDYWDNIQDLPFGFCFFGGTYRSAIICANGQISFNPEVSGQPSGYSLSSKPDIPSPQFVGTGGYNWANAIYGVFEDVDPAYNHLSGGSIYYGVIGEAPCRMLVVTWNKVPLYQSHEPETFMTVLYEGTNVIDVYVKERHISSSDWNNSRGIIGLINEDGTDGIAAPGRNTTSAPWSVTPSTAEAWRFSPYSTPQYLVTYYNGAGTEAEIIGYGDSILIDPLQVKDTITARLQFTACNGDYFDFTDMAVIEWPHLEITEKNATICQGGQYSDKYFTVDKAGEYEYTLQDVNGCDSVYYHLILEEKIADTHVEKATICYGESFRYRGQNINQSGVYAFTDLYEDGCVSLYDTLDLTIKPEISFHIEKQDLVSGPTSGSITISELDEGSYYSVNGVMNGPLTNLGEGDYNIIIYNDYGCATAPQYVHISGDRLEVVTYEYPDFICQDELTLEIPYEVIKGTLTSYDITWDSKGHAARFVDKRDLQPSNNVFTIDIPENVKPGHYDVHIILHDLLDFEPQEIVLPININYSSDVMAQKWGDVLAVYNDKYNGGFHFSRYQWYLNGQPLWGETMSYLNMTKTYELLDTEGYYQVGLTLVGEDEEILSCPFFAHTYQGESGAPEMSRSGNVMNISWGENNGMAQIWNNSAQMISQQPITDGMAQVSLPANHGVYILTVTSDSGERYSFKVVQ